MEYVMCVFLNCYINNFNKNNRKLKLIKYGFN